MVNTRLKTFDPLGCTEGKLRSRFLRAKLTEYVQESELAQVHSEWNFFCKCATG